MADLSRSDVPPAALARADRGNARRIRGLLVYGLLIGGAAIAIVPFLWMFSWSLMTNVEVAVGRAIPAEVHLENYAEAWGTANFARYMWNSVRITGLTVTGLLVFCIPAAYAFAKMRFWGRNTLFALMIATLMIPDIVTLIPNYLTVVWINRLSVSVFGDAGAWLNNWPSLTIPFMASAFTIFMLRQFFIQIPDELWDAARIDGAGHPLFLIRIVVPLSKPAVMTVLTFAFIASWNALLWPLLVVQSEEWLPIAFGLTRFVQNDAGTLQHLQMAGSVIMITPMLIVYFFTQRQFTEGIATTGFKG